MEKEPLLSVIIPVYNSKEYVSAGVKSLLDQSWKKLQIILVDDGSTDGSSEICDEFALTHAQVKCLHQPNRGILLARLAGVKVADGDVIGFIDSDDVIEPDMFERLLANMAQYDADISHCGYKMVYGDKETLYYGTGKVLVQTRPEGVRDLLSGRFIEPTACTKIYKRSLFDGMDFETRIDTAEDLMLNFMLFSKSRRAIYEDITPYHYVRRATSYSKTSKRSRQEKDVDTVMEFMDRFSQNDPEIRQFVLNKRAAVCVQRYNRRIKEGRAVCREFRRQMPKDLHSTNRKTEMQLSAIRLIPDLYDGLYKMRALVKK
ncbi:MAG: glycosyltransferase [Oscillospiraceae bacterium]|nr:glycosyltransferase [Oscillospiraceae bacterium]